jgi:hypothetical protein
MTELYIDGKPVALPEKMILKVKKQNPLITKNGTFSLDLNLSLQELNNSKLYKHIERLHFNAYFKGRKAVLIANNRVFLNGTEAIQKNTDQAVQIQLLSGNSELNYFIGSDRYISELDLGREPELTNSYLNSIIGKRYPAVHFTPAKVRVDDVIYNKDTPAATGTAYTFENPRMQPYLAGMVHRIITGLGYNIALNELAKDEAMCSVYFLNNTNSREYNKMLPGWKAKEFLEECEKFFNITFDISEHDKSVKILKCTSDSRFGTEVINNVIDEYERSFDPEKSEINYHNVAYEFPSPTAYKYYEIAPEILAKADIKTFNTYAQLSAFLEVTIQGWVSASKATGYLESLVLFYCREFDTYYILEPYDYVISEGYEPGKSTWYYLRPINRFNKVETEPDADFVSLKFVPAQFYTYPTGNMWFFATSSCPYQSDKLEGEQEETDIRKYIENGVSLFDSKKRSVSLAFYVGLKEVTGSLVPVHLSSIDYLIDSPYCNSAVDKNRWTLRLDGPYGLHKRYYQVNSRYDNSKEYIIRFLTNKLHDQRAEFLIENRLFACKELEYTILNDGIHPIVTGIFYEIKG